MKQKQTLEARAMAASVWNYVLQLKAELKKVSWTSKSELQALIKVVVTAILCCGVSIYLCDLLVRLLLEGCGLLFRGLFF